MASGAGAFAAIGIAGRGGSTWQGGSGPPKTEVNHTGMRAYFLSCSNAKLKILHPAAVLTKVK
jgi:hypothetical protein